MLFKDKMEVVEEFFLGDWLAVLENTYMCHLSIYNNFLQYSFIWFII